jgi:hypothetical protein
LAGLVGTLLKRVFERRPLVDDRAGLGGFLDSRAAFMAQKGIVEFCRVRAGVHWQALFREPEFGAALSRSCWLAYAPCLSMVAEMVDSNLREAAGLDRPRMTAALSGLAQTVYAGYPVPHGFTADEWAARFSIVRARLEEIVGTPALPVRQMHLKMGRLVFESLPLHRHIVSHDADYILNNLRMHLIRAHDDFTDIANRPQLVASLLAEGPP